MVDDCCEEPFDEVRVYAGSVGPVPPRRDHAALAFAGMHVGGIALEAGRRVHVLLSPADRLYERPVQPVNLRSHLFEGVTFLGLWHHIICLGCIQGLLDMVENSTLVRGSKQRWGQGNRILLGVNFRQKVSFPTSSFALTRFRCDCHGTGILSERGFGTRILSDRGFGGMKGIRGDGANGNGLLIHEGTRRGIEEDSAIVVRGGEGMREWCVFVSVCERLRVFASVCERLRVFTSVCECLRAFVSVCECLSAFVSVCVRS